MTDDVDGLDFSALFAVSKPRPSQTPRGRREKEKKKMSEADRRRLKTTGRTTQMNIKCRAEWRDEVRAYADAHGLQMVEALERAWAAFRGNGK